MKHLRRLGWGLMALGIFAVVVGIIYGVTWLFEISGTTGDVVIITVLCLGFGYFLGAMADQP